MNPNGSIKWNTPLPLSLLGITDNDGIIYVNLDDYIADYCLAAINPSGDILWKLPQIDDTFFNLFPIMNSDGTLYTFADNGNLYAFEEKAEVFVLIQLISPLGQKACNFILSVVLFHQTA